MSDQTSTTTPSREQYEEALGRSAAYDLLSLAFLYPKEGTVALLTERASRMTSVASRLGWVQVAQSVEKLLRDLGSINDEILLNDYLRIFGHTISNDCPPYEGEYGQAHIFQMSKTLADLKTFYHAFGVAPNPELKDRWDHVGVEMEFMHLLTLKEAYAQLHNHGEDKVLLCRRAQQTFMTEHLASWLNTFAQRLGKKAGRGSAYRSLAQLVERYMDRELQAFGLGASPLSQSTEPLAEEKDDECYASPILSDAAQEG